ncbi:MAG: FecR domain-containing protein [Siphonobacter aquaeclarae]|nr:FecR domain-containing protein [Siphonobacter aquaeclarae]
MDYSRFTAEQLATDPFFVRWVRKEDDETRLFWNDWLERHPERREEAELARALVLTWRPKPVLPPPGAAETVWAGIQRDTAPDIRRFGWKTAAGWAAVLAGAGIGLYFFLTQSAEIQQKTLAGQTRVVELPDHSQVVLSGNSSIAYDRDWDGEAPRKVRLKGQAFFSVVHQADHRKFIVETDDHYQVEVLGTTFTVAERNHNLQVVLNTGKVRLRQPGGRPALLMKPGERIEVRNQSVVSRKNVNPVTYSDWKDRRFAFDNASLGDVTEMLEYTYGYDIVFADSTLKEKKITVHLQDPDPDVLLNVLAQTHDLKIDRLENRIYIRP